MSVSTDVNSLMEMGFPQNRAEKAMSKTGYKSVQLAMDWLFAHEDDADIDEPFKAPEGHILGQADAQEEASSEDAVSKTETEQETEVETQPQQAQSLKCDECGKLLKSELDAQAHAARTQHASFSESTEEIKPLTAEEKHEQLTKLHDKLKQRRIEREGKEKKEQIAREKQRRAAGKDNISAKQRIEEEEIKKIAEQRRREKAEEKLARQRVKDQIEKDKAERARKFSKEAKDQKSPSSVPKPVQPSAATTPTQKDYTDTRLQIRLTNGQALTQSFSAKESLASVRLYVEMNRTDGQTPFTLMTTFPKKVFTDDDMEKPLSLLGLVPSAVLILSKPQ